jgi:phosphatidylserine/phosphatidylglycerophosphate/cardiolipin synthase-like enzyme
MKSRWVLILILLAGCSSTPAQKREPIPNWAVYFSPKGGCTEAIVKELGQAKRLILVQAYSLTSAPIAKALLDAHQYGVKVEILLDKSQKTDRLSSADFLARAGVPTRMDTAHAAAHNEVIIIDGEIVITGSFPFTRAAEEQNAENLLIIRNRAMAETYIKNWLEHSRHSEPYVAKTKSDQVF